MNHKIMMRTLELKEVPYKVHQPLQNTYGWYNLFVRDVDLKNNKVVLLLIGVLIFINIISPSDLIVSLTVVAIITILSKRFSEYWHDYYFLLIFLFSSFYIFIKVWLKLPHNTDNDIASFVGVFSLFLFASRQAATILNIIGGLFIGLFRK